MKKSFIILAIAMFALTSCSSSKDNARESLKKQTKAAMEVYRKDMSKSEKDQFDKYTDCYVDGIFNKLDDAAIDDLVKAKSSDIEKILSSKDQEILTKVATECAKNFKVG